MRVSPFGFMKANYLLTVAAAVMLSACSGSVERFAANPSDSDPVYTASIPKYKKPAVAYRAPTYKAPAYVAEVDEEITSRPLASAALKKPTYNYETAYKKPAFKQPAYEAPAEPVVAYKKPKYNAPVYDAPQEQAYNDEPEVAAPKYKKPTYIQPAASNPKPATGATVRVAEGMTMYSIAKANGVTVDQLAEANGIGAPYSVSTGRVLKIPGRTTAQMPTSNYKPKAQVAVADEEIVDAAPAPKKAKAAGNHTVASGETLYSLGRKYGVSPFAIASLNGMSNDTALGVGQSVRIPAGGQTPVVAAKAPSKKLAAPVEEEAVADNTDSEAAIGEEQEVAVAPSKKIPTVKAQPVQQVQASAGPGAMRWPVKGKVISEFGTKPNGLKNEGINVAVPEGTGIRAAESGVVAYAGNQLKGYGNLVLIRHDGGYVTAYAHAKELFVKKGDTVNRGDVIAKAGQTGSVSSPQLHFEVRKGATAMDPMKFLTSATASN